MERLYPEAKLLKDYTEDQKALNAAMELYPQNAAAYQDALAKLGNEYQVNQSKATIWGQMTEGAIDRIDSVFADAWANIGDGAGDLWDKLKQGFKQTLGEIAHMLTTKPLLASFSNWLTGTDNGQGIGAVWGKLLGSVGGSSGSSGGSMFSGFAGAATAGLDGYTFAGLSTFINNLVQVNTSFELINLKMLGMTVAGGKLAESLLIGIGGMEQFTANNQKYYDAFFSDTEKADDTLAAITKQFTAMGYKLPDTREGFRALVESLDTTKESSAAAALTLIKYSDVAAAQYAILEQRATAATEAQKALADAQAATNANYYSLFTTDAEKANDKLSDITAQFAAMGLVLPTTNQDFKNMVYAAGQAGESGKKVFDFLKGSAGNASDAITILAQQAETLKSNAIAGATSAFGTLQRSITAQQKSASDSYKALNTSLSDMLSTATSSVSDLTSVGSDLSSALKALRGDSDDAVRTLRAQAQATLQSALATARAGGSLAGFTGLSDALDTVSDNSTDLYSSLEDFNRDQGRTANVVAELNAINGKQLTAAEKLQESLEDQIKLAEDNYKLETDRYESELTFAQAQLDALNGVDTSILSVAAAVSAMNAAVVAALRTNTATSGAGSASAATPADNATMVNSIYKDLLGRDADAAGSAAWVGALQGGASYQQIVEAIRASAAANGQLLPGHATGGLITGPGTGTSDSILSRLSNGEYVMTAQAVRMFGTGMLDQMNAGFIPAFATGGGIGESGSQLEVTGPSRIYNANQTAAMLNGGGGNTANLEQKVDVLIDVVKQIVGPMKLNSDADSKLFKKWDRVGLPTITAGA